MDMYSFCKTRNGSLYANWPVPVARLCIEVLGDRSRCELIMLLAMIHLLTVGVCIGYMIERRARP